MTSFPLFRQDCLKEKQMQRKLEDSSSNSHSALVEAGREGLALDFERSEPSRRLRLVLRELLRVMNKVIVIYASCLSGKFDLVRNSFHPQLLQSCSTCLKSGYPISTG